MPGCDLDQRVERGGDRLFTTGESSRFDDDRIVITEQCAEVTRRTRGRKLTDSAPNHWIRIGDRVANIAFCDLTASCKLAEHRGADYRSRVSECRPYGVDITVSTGDGDRDSPIICGGVVRVVRHSCKARAMLDWTEPRLKRSRGAAAGVAVVELCGGETVPPCS